MKYGEDYTFYQSNITGKEFLGWYLNGVKIPETGKWTYDFDSPIVLEDRWDVKQYTITYKYRGKSWTETYQEGTQITISVPTGEDYRYYKFAGWYIGNRYIGNPYTVSQDVIFVGRDTKTYSEYTYISNSDEFNKEICSNPAGKYMLVNDINLGSFSPIGTFTGELDGRGYTLSGWSYTQDSVGAIGLFGENKGTIKNLNIEGFKIVSSDPDTSGTLYAGLICGQNGGTIENVVVKASSISVDVGSISHARDSTVFVGMICGYNTGTIAKCGVYQGCNINAYVGTKYEHSEMYAGLIAGYSIRGVFKNVFSHGNIVTVTAKADVKKNFLGIETGHGAPRSYVGGLVGYSKLTTIYMAVSHDNSLSSKVVRSCSHSTNTENRIGSLVGKCIDSEPNYAYSEQSDTLFGYKGLEDFDVITGGGVPDCRTLPTDNMKLSHLPIIFSLDGWTEIDGSPVIEVKLLD